MRSVVVVGGGVAGWRTAESLRREGFSGSLTVIGDELDEPYQRPALSKQYLAARWDRTQTALRQSAPLDAELLLGQRVTGLRLPDRVLTTDRGAELCFDGLVVATGARPRRFAWMEGIEGIFTLRTLDDATRLRAALATARRVVVVGAGFIGTEVAATCRSLGKTVTLVDAAELPLRDAIGDVLARYLLEEHRRQGVDVRVGAGVAAAWGDHTGVRQVELADGTRIDADVVVVGAGVVPNTEMFAGTPAVVDNGLVCDPTNAVLGLDRAVAVGDVARWYHVGYGRACRLEHWDNAVHQAEHAARRLLFDPVDDPYQPVPFFWSDQYAVRLQVVGIPGAGDEFELVSGSWESGKFVLESRDGGGQLNAALVVNTPREFVTRRHAIARALSDRASALTQST